MAANATITVSAVVLTRPDGTVLTVRKSGTQMFMLPGGKPEERETPRDTAVREIREELGLELAPESLTLLGEFNTDAANEAETTLLAHVFEYPKFDDRIDVAPQAEIVECQWVLPTDPEVYTSPVTAPLNADLVFPLLAQRDVDTSIAAAHTELHDGTST